MAKTLSFLSSFSPLSSVPGHKIPHHNEPFLALLSRKKRTFSQVPIYLKTAEKNMWDPSLTKRPDGIIIGQKECLQLKRRNSILTFCIFPHTRLQKKNSFVVTPFSHDLGRPARKGIDQTWALPNLFFQNIFANRKSLWFVAMTKVCSFCLVLLLSLVCCIFHS